jgi:hypothetical protein
MESIAKLRLDQGKSGEGLLGLGWGKCVSTAAAGQAQTVGNNLGMAVQPCRGRAAARGHPHPA